MITLQEIFDNLTYGELSQTALGGGGIGFIAEADYPKAVSFVNMALTALHRRFALSKGKLYLQQYSTISTYYLRSDYAVSNTTSVEETKYIVDTAAKPFTDNILRVEEIFSADGVPYSLNDSSIDVPIYTPRFDEIEMVPGLLPEFPVELLSVTYRANHAKLTVASGFDPSVVYLHIPEYILEALLNHVAARVFAPISAGEGETSLNRVFAARYELECLKIERNNMQPDADKVEDRFDTRGWC